MNNFHYNEFEQFVEEKGLGRSKRIFQKNFKLQISRDMWK